MTRSVQPQVSSHTQYNLNNLWTPDRSVEKIVWSDDCHLLHLYGAPEHAQTAPTHPYLLHWDRLPCKGVLRVHTGAGLAPPSKHGTLSQASPVHSYRLCRDILLGCCSRTAHWQLLNQMIGVKWEACWQCHSHCCRNGLCTSRSLLTWRHFKCAVEAPGKTETQEEASTIPTLSRNRDHRTQGCTQLGFYLSDYSGSKMAF